MGFPLRVFVRGGRSRGCRKEETVVGGRPCAGLGRRRRRRGFPLFRLSKKKRKKENGKREGKEEIKKKRNKEEKKRNKKRGKRKRKKEIK